MAKNAQHSPAEITRAATLFFMVRGMVRTKLAAGRKLDPYAWLRIETLVHIRDAKGPSMRAIADYLSITAPSATSLVNALEKGGLVKRRADPRDKRAVRVYLTKKGQEKLKAAVDRGMEIFGGLFAPLSKADLAAFTRHLDRINKAGS